MHGSVACLPKSALPKREDMCRETFHNVSIIQRRTWTLQSLKAGGNQDLLCCEPGPWEAVGLHPMMKLSMHQTTC